MLSGQDIREMADSGLVAFGGHTESHAILSALPAERQEQEIRASLDRLGAILDRPCTEFAYPNGRFADYDRHSMACLEQAGVAIAVTAEPGPNSWHVDRLQLRRDPLGPRDDGAAFRQRLHWMQLRDRRAAGRPS